MKKSLTLIFVVALLALALPAGAQAPAGEPEIAPINGTANWATAPTGPDFSGVTLIPFPARNPTRAAWEQTLAQNRLYLSPEAIPDNVQVSHSGIITGASHFVNDFSEVMVALDPTDPNHLLGCSKFFYNPAAYDFYTGVFESYDGGLTWTELQPAGVETYSMTSDPVTTFDHLGNGYFTLLTRGPTGLDMLKKPAGGDWLLPVIVDRTTYTDKQWIIADQDPHGVSPYPGYLYMSWTSFGGPVTGIVFSRSTDGNLTWRAPIALAGGDVQGSVPGVAPDGTVYVVFGRGIFYGPAAGTLEIVKSTDGGYTFGAPTVAANITAIPFTLPNSTFRTPASLPAFAVSPADGSLHVAWADYRHGDADIYYTYSANGTAWSAPVRLNDDPVGNGVDQFQPQVSVAPNGRVAVMWFDRRLPCPDLPWIPPAHRGDPNYCIDTFVTRSYDGGQTWVPNIRASAQTWDWSLNLPLDGSGYGFIGDYQGIASNDAYDFPFWNATANLGDNAENYQEAFVALLPATFFDLSPSKTVEPGLVDPGGVLTYTLLLDNAGPEDAPGVRLTDTLPISTTYVPDSLSYSSGAGGYDPATGAITWTGAVTASQSVAVTFRAAVDPAAPDGTAITNTAAIRDSLGRLYERTAVARASIPPTVVHTYPADGQTGVPITAPLVITFSEPIDVASWVVAISPDPGLEPSVWSPDLTAVTVYHLPLAYDQRYTVTVAAADLDGRALVPGPVPNPWSFTTGARPLVRVYLPLVTKDFRP